jgi:hypothetical protein
MFNKVFKWFRKPKLSAAELLLFNSIFPKPILDDKTVEIFHKIREERGEINNGTLQNLADLGDDMLKAITLRNKDV